MQVEPVLSVKRQPLATRSGLEKAVEVARELRQRERFNKLDFYDPLPVPAKISRHRCRRQSAVADGGKQNWKILLRRSGDVLPCHWVIPKLVEWA